MVEAHLACSMDQQRLIQPIIDRLNAQGQIHFNGSYYPEKDIVRPVLYRDFGMICPKSVLTLQALEDQWEALRGRVEGSIFSRTVTFGVTPVVFFMSPHVAHRLSVFERRFGWLSLLGAIKTQELRIRHASFREQDGIAVAIAQYLAFAKQSPGDEAAAQIKSIEQAVEEYGPDDAEVLRRATGDGEWATDLVIAQEQSIIAMTTCAPKTGGVIVYPHDGILAIPAAVASVSGWERPRHEEAFHLLASGLSDLQSAELAANGLHKDASAFVAPDALKEFATAASSQTGSALQWAAHAGATTLVLPGRRTVRGIRSLASSAKRPVDVCLLFDSSGSMSQGNKFPQAQAAIDDFLDLLEGAGSRACLVRFQTEATILTPLRVPVRPFYPHGALDPNGDTALLDAVGLGLDTLDGSGDPGHIWAIVAFTDGGENSSLISLSALEQRLKISGRIRFYGIAYGLDADLAPLTALANATDGMALRGDHTTIRALYERLSAYV